MNVCVCGPWNETVLGDCTARWQSHTWV